MRGLSRRLWTGVLALALCGLGLPWAAVAGQVIEAVSAWPQTEYEGQNFIKFLEIVRHNIAAQAPGQLEIKYLGGPDVIPHREQVEALRNGSVDMLFTASDDYVSAVPVVAGLNLTAYTPGEERVRGVNDFLNQVHNAKVNAEYLGRLGTDLPFMLFLNQPLDKADLTGMKIRCSPTHIEFLKQLGAQPVVIAPPDVYMALERRVVDGFVWVAGRIRDWGWHQVAKFRVEPGFYLANNVVLVNKSVWDQLPANVQNIVRASEVEAENMAVARGRDHLAKENAAMAAGGMQLVQLSPVEAAKLKNAADEALWRVVIKTSGADGEKLRALISK